VTKGRRPPITHIPVSRGARGIQELDRFTETTLKRWQTAAQDLDELEDILYFGPEPERRRLRPEILAALQRVAPAPLSTDGWVRVVTYRYGNQPLSCAGSLVGAGGRFNAGMDLDGSTLQPWPALYVAEDYETAFREKFQLAQGERVNGLSPQELALETGKSHSTVFVNGRFARVFDLTSDSTLTPLAAVLRKIKLPPRARVLRKKLGIKPGEIYMAQTAKQLYDMVIVQNWRMLPVQFGLPARSQILAEMIRAADFEGIMYKSTKGPGRCLAIFPDKLDDASFLELADATPPGVKFNRLDQQTGDELSGLLGLTRGAAKP